MDIIKGSDLSNFNTIGMSVAVSKKDNRQGQKSRFLVLTLQDEDGGYPTKMTMFEEELAPGTLEILGKYVMKDDKNEVVKDSQGGAIIDFKALKASDDAKEGLLKGLMHWPGGMFMDYKLKKGECYSNDRDGKRILDGWNQPVIRTTIPVFVQVKFVMDGKFTFTNRMSLEARGSRMENQLYHVAVNPANQKEVEVPAEETPAQSANPF